MRASTTAALLATALLARGEAAQQVRVTLRVIEVSHAQVMKWTGGAPMKGSQLHDEAVKLALAGGAEIVETNVLTVRSGEKATQDSVAEIIYPCEVDTSDPRSRPNVPSKETEAILEAKSSRFGGASNFYSFDTRKTGVELVIETDVSADRKTVGLGIRYKMVNRASLTTWTELRDPWGDASVRMPVFDSKRVASNSTFADGVFDLWNIFTPKPAAVPAVTTRQLIFVRADVLPLSENP